MHTTTVTDNPHEAEAHRHATRHLSRDEFVSTLSERYVKEASFGASDATQVAEEAWTLFTKDGANFTEHEVMSLSLHEVCFDVGLAHMFNEG